MSGPLIGMRRRRCEGTTCLSGPVSWLTVGGLEHRRHSGPATSGVCAVVLPGRRQSLPLTGPTRAGPRARRPGRLALAVARRAARAVCRRPGCAAARIEVIATRRRARRLGAAPPASAAARGRRPGASLPGPGAAPHPPLVRAPCPGRCPRPGPGGMRYMARHLMIARLPAPGPPGRGHDTGAAVTCAFTAMARIWRGCPGIPGAAGMAWRDWRWGASASCGQPLVPTGPQGPARIFSNHMVLAGAPLRNRTVDLLLTMHTRFV